MLGCKILSRSADVRDIVSGLENEGGEMEDVELEGSKYQSRQESDSAHADQECSAAE